MAQDLGEAKGTIKLDADQLETVAGKVKGVGQKIEKDLGRVDTAAKRTTVSLGRLGKVMGGAGALFGIQQGIQLVRQIGQAVIATSELATAYKRQSVAAVELAGSQSKLNQLMATYDDVTKGVVDNATAMGDVTRLMAMGFADSAEEMKTFLQAARGISVAMGSSQDYVISQLQLTIANQSKMRLDQLGLGIGEVDARVKKLKASNKGLTQEMAFQQAVLGIANEKFGVLNTAIEAQATGMERLIKLAKDYRLEMGKDIESPLNQGAGLIASYWENRTKGAQNRRELDELNQGTRMGQLGFIEGETTTWTDVFDYLFGNMGGAEAVGNFASSIFFGPSDEDVQEARNAYAAAIPTIAYRTGIGAGIREGVTGGAGVGAGVDEGPSPQKIALVSAHYAAVANIEKQANAARLNEIKNYEQSRAQIIQSYGLSVVREAEDFALSRSRSQAAFANSVADMRRDAGRREADMREENARITGEAREKSQERIAKITADYHRDLERSEANHKERLLGSAAKLDAAGVVAEQRRWAKEKKQKETNFNKAVRREKDSLAEQEKARAESMQRQLELAERNDERRLDDMKRNFERQRIQEDEDREISRRRAEEDHGLQMEAMRVAHEEKMVQIGINEQTEKDAEQEKFKAQMIEAGLGHEKWIEEQKKFQEKSLETFKDWWDDLDKVMNNRGSVGDAQPDPVRGGDDPQHMEQFGDGGPVNRSGPAIVHAGEYVLTNQTTAALRGMMGSSFGQSDVLQAMGGKNINVSEGAVQITASEGMNVEQLGEVVRAEMLAALQIAS